MSRESETVFVCVFVCVFVRASVCLEKVKPFLCVGACVCVCGWLCLGLRVCVFKKDFTSLHYAAHLINKTQSVCVCVCVCVCMFVVVRR